MKVNNNLIKCSLIFFFIVSLEIKNEYKKIIFCDMMLFPLGHIVTNGSSGYLYFICIFKRRFDSYIRQHTPNRSNYKNY